MNKIKKNDKGIESKNKDNPVELQVINTTTKLETVQNPEQINYILNIKEKSLSKESLIKNTDSKSQNKAKSRDKSKVNDKDDSSDNYNNSKDSDEINQDQHWWEEKEQPKEKESKITVIMVETIRTIVFTWVGIGYSLTWAVLFFYYNESESYQASCNTLKEWDRVWYILQLINCFLYFVSTVIKCLSCCFTQESSVLKVIVGCKGCVNCVTGLAFLLAISVVFFDKDYSDCGPLYKVTLAYIISEWTILGGSIFCVCLICNVSLIYRNWKSEDIEEEDEEEDEGYV